uniref:Phosphoprotein n=1 Tax=Heterorhabditis bacteriophora TaxID=37862 RepID=A0A1I7XT26_HETBA
MNLSTAGYCLVNTTVTEIQPRLSSPPSRTPPFPMGMAQSILIGLDSSPDDSPELTAWIGKGECPPSELHSLLYSKKMSAISTEGPPEAKKFRIDLPTQPSPGVAAPLQGEAPQEGQSPAGPSSARSSNGSEVSSGSVDKEDDVEPGMTGSLLEMISKSLLGNVFKSMFDQRDRTTRICVLYMSFAH